jgi:hypothetical protein
MTEEEIGGMIPGFAAAPRRGGQIGFNYRFSDSEGRLR